MHMTIRYLEGREILTRAFLQETFGAETYPDLLKQLTGSPKRCPA